MSHQIAGIRIRVIKMKYDDPEMERYFLSLPPETQEFINQSGAEISTLGELMEIGEHFKHDV